MAKSEKLYWAGLPMVYGPMGHETQLDHGQVTTLAPVPNNEKLLRLRYLREIEEMTDFAQCPECGAQFLDAPMRAGHVTLRHPRKDRTPMEEDAALERAYARAQQSTPLALDQTTASKRG